ncbi:unnamed protein product [Closterium sp. NIES-53]
MASLRVLVIDHEGRPVQFDMWQDDLQLYLLSDSKDNVSLFDLASGAATAPPATFDSSTRSQTPQALYDAVVARYSSPTTAALDRLLLPYLFPELSAFATIEDLVSHLHASDARYRAAVPAEFLDRNPPPMYITLYFTVTRLLDSLRSVWDHFLSLDPTSLTVELLEQHLLAAETSAVAVGAARGTPRAPFFEGCSPSPLAPSYASAAAADVSVPEDVGAASTSAKHRSSKAKGGTGGGDDSGGGGGGSGSGGGGSSRGGSGGGKVGGSGGSGGGGGGSGGSGGSGGGGTGSGGTGARRVDTGGGQLQQHQRRSETPSPQQLREWFLRGASGGSCPYVIRTGDRVGQTCGRLHTQHRCFSHLDDAWRAEFGDDVELPRWADLLKSKIAILDLDFGAILSTMYALSVSAEGDCYRCVPPDPGIAAVALGASESSTLPGIAPAAALHTFVTAPPSLLFLHRSRSDWLTPLGARSWPVPPLSSRVRRFRLAHSHVFTSPRSLRTWSLPPLPPSLAPPCLPCVEGWQGAAPHSSSFPRTITPLQTLHMDVWGPARVSGQSRERYFLLVVDDYSRYTTVFLLRSKGQVVDLLIPWIRTVHLQLRECFGQDLPVLRLHSDRGGEFSSNLLRDFCRGEGILQSFTLLNSPQQNGIAERRIGLVMEVARTSMIHAAAPHFLWPFAVRYAAHKLNLWPHVSLPETSPTLRWTGKVGDASVFRVWGSRAFVRDTSADKLSPRAIPCVFLGFVPDAPGWQFYYRTSRRVFPSQDVMFDESVPFYRLFPYRSAPLPPPPPFLAPGPPTVDPLPPQGPAPLGVSQVVPLPGFAPVQGAETGGTELGGVETRGVEPGVVATGGAEPEDVEPGGVEFGGAEPQGAALFGGSAGASPSLSPQQLREWFVRRTRLRSGATGAGGAGPAGAGGTGVAAGAGVIGGAATTGPGGARTRGTGAAGTGGVEGVGAGDLTESGAAGTGGTGARGAGVGGPGAGGSGVGGPGVGGAGAGGAGAVAPDGAVRP